nr:MULTISPECIES: WhiB family transcriptional regulator [Rhodococcus]
MCAQRLVRTVCRDHALTAGEPYGIWGGMSEADRTRHRRRGRRRERRRSSPAPT